MSKHRTMLLAIAVLGLWAMCAGAGPLDRYDYEPRRNPAADTMIRVPGVLGMDPQSAMQALQQAGLHPFLKAEKKFNPQYQGREGTVVKQIPGPGGMAILGSSVTITYYAPPSPETPPPPSDDGKPDSGTTPPSSPGGTTSGGTSGGGTPPPPPSSSPSGTPPPAERPKAVLIAPKAVPHGRGFTLDGGKSSAASGRRIVTYHWTWVTRGLDAQTAEPAMEVRYSDENPIPAGVNQFRLVVEDDAGNRSEPASARVMVQKPKPNSPGKPQGSPKDK